MATINFIHVKDLHHWLTSGKAFSLVDVRDAQEYAMCRIDTSWHIPLASIHKIMDYYERTHPMVFYCHHGIRSERAALCALDMGFQSVYTLSGGIDLWAQLIEPGMVRY